MFFLGLSCVYLVLLLSHSVSVRRGQRKKKKKKHDLRLSHVFTPILSSFLVDWASVPRSVVSFLCLFSGLRQPARGEKILCKIIKKKKKSGQIKGRAVDVTIMIAFVQHRLATNLSILSVFFFLDGDKLQ